MGYDFDGGDYHHLYETEGKDPIDGTFHYTTHSFLGSQYNDGKADAFRKVKEGIDVGGLQEQADGWENVHTHIAGVHTRLSKAYQDLFADGWSGDDADKANKTFRDTTNSVASIKDSSLQMKTGTKRIAKAAAAACGTEADGPSGGAKFVNAAIGPFGGNGDGDGDQQAYFTLVNEVDGGRSAMPQQVEWQTKTTATNQQGGADPGTNPNPGKGVNGVTSPGSPGSPQHVSSQTPGLTKPPSLTHPGSTHPGETTHPTTTDDSGTGLDNGTSGLNGSGLSGTSPLHSGSGLAAYHGAPGLDTSSSLAGYDPSGGAGGAGLGAGGGLSSGAGGIGSAGSGLGGLGGAGSGLGSAGSGLGSAGSGLGSAGSGLASAGFGGGAGTGLAGSGRGLAGSGSGRAGAGLEGEGAGGRGAGGQVAPMRGGGGGGGGDDSERERSTWLQEDDDVWGGSDAPPSVIS